MPSTLIHDFTVLADQLTYSEESVVRFNRLIQAAIAAAPLNPVKLELAKIKMAVNQKFYDLRRGVL